MDLDAWIENPVRNVRSNTDIATYHPTLLDGVRLEDSRTLSSHGVKDGSTLHLWTLERDVMESCSSDGSLSVELTKVGVPIQLIHSTIFPGPAIGGDIQQIQLYLGTSGEMAKKLAENSSLDLIDKF